MTDHSDLAEESLQLLRLTSDAYSLAVRQGPERAKVFSGPKEKDRKPIDPPPIIQLQIRDPADPAQNYLQSPYFFMCCNLYDSNLDHHDQLSVAEQGDSLEKASHSALAGTLVSSLHRLKDVDNSDGGFFVFPDVSVKVEGDFRLKFSLFEMLKTAPKVVFIKSIISQPFTVYPPRTFPGMSESTFLSRSFGDQGVKLRIRKEPRILGKRTATSDLPYHDSFRSNAQLLPHNYRSMQSQSQAENVGGSGHSMYRDSGFGYDERPSKRQRTSVDWGRAHEANQRSPHRSLLQQREQHQTQLRDAPMSGRTSYHSQGQSPAPGSVSEFSFGHQRANSSSASPPFVSPRNECPSNYSSAFIFQSPSRETNTQYPYNQYASVQTRPSSRFSQPPPVPPDRRLPSSGPSQPDPLRSNYHLQDNPGSLPSATRYSDTNLLGYQQPQTYNSQYESITQPTPRTLPPPGQISTSILPSLNTFAASQPYTSFADAGPHGSTASPYRS